MNEQIRLFAEQAFNQANDGTIADIKIPREFIDRFAQLIVGECIEVVKPTSHHEAWAQSYLGGVDGLDLLYSKVKDIKKHFGVEP